MRFFVDPDTHWDSEGYWARFPQLQLRLSKRDYRLLSTTSFHDGHTLAVKVVNLATWGSRSRLDPTRVEIDLWHRNEYRYHLDYSGVAAVDFRFDWRKQTFEGCSSHELAPDWKSSGRG